MGRPSNQAERKEQILAAFEACVAKYGVEGATLERLSEEAGLARPLIRHHAGNREDLMEALIGRFLERANAMTESVVADLSAENRTESLLGRLFDEWDADFDLVVLAEALIASSAGRPELARKIGRWIESFTGAIADQIALAVPEAGAAVVRTVATGVVAIYFNANSLAPLVEMKGLRAESKDAARRLVETL